MLSIIIVWQRCQCSEDMFIVSASCMTAYISSVASGYAPFPTHLYNPYFPNTLRSTTTPFHYKSRQKLRNIFKHSEHNMKTEPIYSSEGNISQFDCFWHNLLWMQDFNLLSEEWCLDAKYEQLGWGRIEVGMVQKVSLYAIHKVEQRYQPISVILMLMFLSCTLREHSILLLIHAFAILCE